MLGKIADGTRALRIGRTRAIDTTIDRALNGVETPVFYRGRQVGTRTTYNDRLLVAALRATNAGYAGQPLWTEADKEGC